MSQLIDIDLQIQPEPEPDGYEFSYYMFDLLPTLEVTNVEITEKELLKIKDKDYLLMLLILFDFMKNQRFSHKQNKFLAVRQAFARIHLGFFQV